MGAPASRQRANRRIGIEPERLVAVMGAPASLSVGSTQARPDAAAWSAYELGGLHGVDVFVTSTVSASRCREIRRDRPAVERASPAAASFTMAAWPTTLP
jgi:hypothetical protein